MLQDQIYLFRKGRRMDKTEKGNQEQSREKRRELLFTGPLPK